MTTTVFSVSPRTSPTGTFVPSAVMIRATVIICPATLSPSIINTAVSSADRSRASSSLSACSVAALNRRDTADFDCRLPVDADRFGDVDVAAGGDPGEHPLDHDLAQQILRRERLPRRQLDLAAVDEAAPRPRRR